jgi:cobalt/nickel transport system permease protein
MPVTLPSCHDSGNRATLRLSVHIYDGFLSTPVWAAMDVTAVPAVGYIVRRAQRDFDTTRIPLLGVMGAFVFAAQMINFPVGLGTSAHLLGGALLVCTLGPPAASVVMCAIIAMQALVFQDGGVLALGANIVNMAIGAVAAAYLPLRLWGRNRRTIFAAGVLSVLASGLLALLELRLSHIAITGGLLRISLVVFAIAALLEGGITVAVVDALEAMKSGRVPQPRPPLFSWEWIQLLPVLLAAVGLLVASAAPDAIEALGKRTGNAARTLFSTPLSGYELAWLHTPWLRKASAATAGVLLIYAACMLIGRGFTRRRRA